MASKKSKLNNITAHYHKFQDNQVLTSGQLNQFISYFEDQDRLSRILLTGTGIVCGFEIKDVNVEEASITITQGVGVTTDGDLITLKKKTEEGWGINQKAFAYTHYREFVDDSVNYNFFYSSKSPEKKMKLWELLPAETEKSSPLSGLEGWQNKVLLLYLEAYEKEGGLCTTIDCDNQGIEQVRRLRLLLVSREDADILAQKDALFSKYNVFDIFQKLPHLAVPRVILSAQKNLSYDALKKAYDSEAINATRISLKHGVQKFYEGFGNLLNLESFQTQFNDFPDKLDRLLNDDSYKISIGFQYRYDLLKDLVDTWNELRAELLAIKTVCFPNVEAFPKHLLLGNLDEINETRKSNRHLFYKSKALTCGTNKLNYCRSLVARFFIMLENFYTGYRDIRITPSNKLTKLGSRAIPFYYALDGDLLKSWDFEKAENPGTQENQNYHRESPSGLPQIEEPLHYNMDRHDFLRIEGHQGKTYQKALDELLDDKKKYGLSFDVKAIPLNLDDESIAIADYSCEFEDLSLLLKTWKAEQECILKSVVKFFSSFSVVEPGKNRVVGKRLTYSQIGYYDYNTYVEIVGSEGIKAKQEKAEKERNKGLKQSPSQGPYMVKSITPQDQVAYDKPMKVADHVDTGEGTLGKAFAENNLLIKVIDNQQSTEDIALLLKTHLYKGIDMEMWANKPAVKELFLEIPVSIIAYAHVLTQRIPAVITEVNDDSVSNYQTTLKKVCALVDELKLKYQTADSKNITEEQKILIGMLINQLSKICCSGKKLETLNEEIKDRKEKILTELKFSEFIKKHPGLEHKTGVEPGGTFVMVYLNKESSGNSEIFNVSVPGYVYEYHEKGYFDDIRFAGPHGDWTLVGDYPSVEVIGEIMNLSAAMDDIAGLQLSSDKKAELYDLVSQNQEMFDSLRFSALRRDRKSTTLNFGAKPRKDSVSPKIFKNKMKEVVGIELSPKNLVHLKKATDNIIKHHIKAPEKREYKAVLDTMSVMEAGLGRKVKVTPEMVHEGVKIARSGKSLSNVESRGIIETIWERRKKYHVNIPKNTVIADFCLPYQCCSDCSPVNFIVKKPRTWLHLEKDKVCLAQNTQIGYQVHPTDGEIQSSPELKGMTIKEGKISFNLETFKGYGKTISFTVNQQETEAQLTVYRELQIDFDYKVINKYFKQGVRLIFQPSRKDVEDGDFYWSFDEGNFHWDFGDGNYGYQQDALHWYDLPINETNTVEVTLTVTAPNGYCKAVEKKVIPLNKLIKEQKGIKDIPRKESEKKPRIKKEILKEDEIVKSKEKRLKKSNVLVLGDQEKKVLKKFRGNKQVAEFIENFDVKTDLEIKGDIVLPKEEVQRVGKTIDITKLRGPRGGMPTTSDIAIIKALNAGMNVSRK